MIQLNKRDKEVLITMKENCCKLCREHKWINGTLYCGKANKIVVQMYSCPTGDYDMLVSRTKPYVSTPVYTSSSQSSQSQQQCVPKCPTCGSTNVAPITTGKKMLGLLTLGLASKGIGKSYCCKNCGYYW